MGNRQPTVKDVAHHAGVSQGVVSRVVNGTGAVSEHTRKRVLASIEALNYRPHGAARDLRTSTTNTIGLMLADVANPFFARLADRMVQHASARGLGVLLATTRESSELERDNIELLREKRVHGVIATPTTGNVAAWRKLRQLDVELTFVDRTLPKVPGVDEVGIANEQAAYSATCHLLEHGHRKIALLSGPSSTSTGRDRTSGYRRALASWGVSTADDLVRDHPFNSEGVEPVIDELLALPHPPTALLIGNTAVSDIAVRRLVRHRVNIPRELSVVVFHDAPWTELMSPPLTVVRHQLDALAGYAVELLHERMSTPTTRRRRLQVASELVVRDSVTDLTTADSQSVPGQPQ